MNGVDLCSHREWRRGGSVRASEGAVGPGNKWERRAMIRGTERDGTRGATGEASRDTPRAAGPGGVAG
ncbi:hypothetical protein B296_00047097, partial [Ensete ventricosum]